jgi:hypothetical protein
MGIRYMFDIRSRSPDQLDLGRVRSIHPVPCNRVGIRYMFDIRSRSPEAAGNTERGPA